ncbi:zinc-binding alcohol dehydrogenase family protein [soil metagenome]
MKTLSCLQPGTLQYTSTEKPVTQPGETILKIERIGICGTDLHAYEGTQPFFNYPRILGHELAATIVQTRAEGFNEGEAVSIIPYFNCGHCVACRSGKPNCCTNLKVFGVHVDGGMREFISVPDYALVHGDGLSFDELALVEPLAIGAHCIWRAGVTADEFVLVIGAGPIGLGTMEFARIAGAKVIAMDINNDRLEFCTRELKVDYTINPVESDAVAVLSTITGGDMPTVIIDATGNLNAINSAFQCMAHGGRYVLVGLQKGNISFNHPEFHKRESTLMSSRNATRTDFEHVMNSMKKGLVKPTTYITHRVAFDAVKTDFESWLNPAAGVIKAMVEM